MDAKVISTVVCLLALAGCELPADVSEPAAEPISGNEVVALPAPGEPFTPPVPPAPGEPSTPSVPPAKPPVPPAPGCSVAPGVLRATASALIAELPENSCARLRLCIDPEAWRDLPQNRFIPGIDIVILFDVTGSMNPYIKTMTHNMRQLIDNLGTLTPSLRLGLASFRDYGDRSGTSTDRPFMVNVPLTSETEKVRAELSRLRADNGGDTPESLATAVKAVVDGKEHPPYFGASDMGFSADPDRIKIVLGVTDAMNRRERLPRGAPDLSQVAALLKERGVLFLGIGYKRSRSSRASEDVAEAVGASMEGSLGVRARSRAKVAKTVKRGPAEWTLEAGSNDQSSFGDLAYLARMTGAIAKSPGVDLDGDGKTETYGEIAPGEPAVLLMTPRGELEGAPSSSNPTRVLADAITAMVERVRPFQFRLALSAEGRSLDPEADSIAVAPESEYQGCFVPVTIGARSNPAIGACPVMTEVRASIEELSSVTAVDPANLKAVLEVAPNCLGLPRPEPKPDPTAHPSPVPPVCRGPGCGGGAVGI